MQNTYEERKEARRQRLERSAERARDLSDQSYRAARGAVENIPFGQPILVGHHSERKHRAAIGRYDANMRRSVDADKKAEHYTRKAEAVGTGGISSDDPEALQKLRAELKNLEDSQDVMKKANAILRQSRNTTDKTAALVELGFSEDEARNLQDPNSIRGVGFPAYSLNNNRNNIRRVQLRIKELEAIAQRQTVELTCEGYRYREDIEDNRIAFYFDGKPEKDVRVFLGKHGFKWSPSREGTPWVRKITGNALYDAKTVRKFLDERAKNQEGSN